MHVLRTSPLLARLILVWFALTLGAAMASPIVHPKAIEIVCTAVGGMKLIVTGDDGQSVEMGRHTLDCPLCLAATVPLPDTPHVALPMPQPLAHALTPMVVARMAAIVGAPLPARGPPPLA